VIDGATRGAANNRRPTDDPAEHNADVLTDAQRGTFASTGILKLANAFAPDEAARMRGVVWGELRRRHGIDECDPSTWNLHPPVGLKTSKTHPAFAPIFGEVLCGALDELFGDYGWARPRHFGQTLVTMPNSSEWRVPHKLWHADFAYAYPVDQLFAVKTWTCIGDVAPGGGGTPQLAGSHRLTVRYLEHHAGEDYKVIRDGFMRSTPWLRALSHADADSERNRRFMDAETIVDGVALRVVEVTGAPGDIYITHPWVMHSIAANALDQPRLMRSVAIYRRDFKELAA
jgi:hypothetical protein